MKKTYICPVATTIAFDMENATAVNVNVGSKGTGITTTQNDDWSNQREWNSSNWGEEENFNED